MSFAGLGDPPQSPPGRARGCTTVGGYMRKEQAEQRLGLGKRQYWRTGRIPGCMRLSAGLRPPRRLRGAPFWCRELASPFLAKPIQMSFAGWGNPPQSPPGRARGCTTVGGYMRRESQAPVGGMSRRDSLALGTSPRQPSQAAVCPISYIAALAWCPTVCRGTDDCGEHHPSTAAPLAHLARGCAASGKTPFRRKGIPHVRRGVGYVGAWLLARPFQSHRGYLPVGEASGLNLPVGPPLGALRR